MDKALIAVLVLITATFFIIWLLVSIYDRKKKDRYEKNV